MLTEVYQTHCSYKRFGKEISSSS